MVVVVLAVARARVGLVVIPVLVKQQRDKPDNSRVARIHTV